MEQKFSPDEQQEVQYLIQKIKGWQNLFFFELEYYFDGWAITLKEKTIYPRIIIIFKSNNSKSYSIKSYEVHDKIDGNKIHEELYSKINIKSKEKIVEELRQVINGKDLMHCVKSKFKKTQE